MPSKSLVNTTATGIIDVPSPSNSGLAQNGWAGGIIDFSIMCTDGTDYQTLTGILAYAIANKNGTLTVSLVDNASNRASALSAGTLTLSWTSSITNGVVTIKATVTTSLVPLNYCMVYNVTPNIGNYTIL